MIYVNSFLFLWLFCWTVYFVCSLFCLSLRIIIWKIRQKQNEKIGVIKKVEMRFKNSKSGKNTDYNKSVHTNKINWNKNQWNKIKINQHKIKINKNKKWNNYLSAHSYHGCQACSVIIQK